MNTKLNITAYLIAALIMGVVFGEYVGWPFLATPIEKQLTSLINREVSFNNNKQVKVANPNISKSHLVNIKPFHISFLGGITLKTANLYIAAPSWSSKKHFLIGNNVLIKLRYLDMWHAYRGLQIRINVLQAGFMDVNLERTADGRSSWQFRNKVTELDKAIRLPTFNKLLLSNGLLHIENVPLKSNIEAKLSLIGNVTKIDNAMDDFNALDNSRLTVIASGRFKDLPLKIKLISTSAPNSTISQTNILPASIIFNANVGRANINFKGTTKDMLRPIDFAGNYSMSGPSLAAVGDLVGVTLPTTAKFSSNGSIEKQNQIWRTSI